MDAIRGFANFVKNVATGGRDAARIAEDGSYALELAKRKIIKGLLGLFKTFIYQFLIFAIIIAFVVGSTALVFEMFSNAMYGNGSDVSSVNPAEMKEWSDNLSEEDIKDIQAYGASIHPRKIHRYAEIEDLSYQKNINLKVPQLTATWSSDSGRNESTQYIDYLFTRGDVSYPYRQWWQSTAGLDAINDTASKENNLKLINAAKEGLKPIFNWADPSYMVFEENSKYNRTSPKEEVVVNTKVTRVTVSGEGSSKTTTYYTEVTTWRPLPFLNQVDTMFSNTTFAYRPIHSTNTSHATPKVEHYTKTSTKMVDGVEVETEKHYTRTTNTSYTTEINSWASKDSTNEYGTKFMDFMDSNKMNTRDDPIMLLEITKRLPQSYDYGAQLEGYLDYLKFSGYESGMVGGGGSYIGDFGDFSGGTFKWPVPSSSRITSYYGYRIHPIFKTKKMHTGIDIAAGMGTDILAVADGTVSLVGSSGGYGLTVKINHGGGIESLYAHNSRLLVRAGQTVRKGDLIAKAGSTGNSTGPHLHFEVRKNGKHVDPIPWLRN